MGFTFFASTRFLVTLISFSIFYESQQGREENERRNHQGTNADGEEFAHAGHATVRRERESAEAQDGR